LIKRKLLSILKNLRQITISQSNEYTTYILIKKSISFETNEFIADKMVKSPILNICNFLNSLIVFYHKEYYDSIEMIEIKNKKMIVSNKMTIFDYLLDTFIYFIPFYKYLYNKIEITWNYDCL